MFTKDVAQQIFSSLSTFWSHMAVHKYLLTLARFVSIGIARWITVICYSITSWINYIKSFTFKFQALIDKLFFLGCFVVFTCWYYISDFIVYFFCQPFDCALITNSKYKIYKIRYLSGLQFVIFVALLIPKITIHTVYSQNYTYQDEIKFDKKVKLCKG